MALLVTPEMLDAFAVSGSPEQVARQIWQRFGDLADDIVLASESNSPQTLAVIAAALKALAACTH